jgi:hypothetical protein
LRCIEIRRKEIMDRKQTKVKLYAELEVDSTREAELEVEGEIEINCPSFGMRELLFIAASVQFLFFGVADMTINMYLDYQSLVSRSQEELK